MQRKIVVTCESLEEGLCIVTFFLFPDSGLYLWNGFDFLFRYVLNDVTLKTSNCVYYPSNHLATWADLKIREYLTTNHRSGRHGGLIVSALDSEVSSLVLSPGRGHYVVFLGKTQFTITVPLSTQVYK